MNNGDGVEAIKKYFEKGKFTFQPLREKGAETSKAYGVQAYPTNYVVGPDGKIAVRTIGFNEEKLKAALEKVARKK